MTQQLDLASAARIAALVIREEEGQRKFAIFLREAVQRHNDDLAPASRSPELQAAGNDLATAARKLLVAIKTIKKGASWFGAFDKLEHELERIVPMTEQVFRRRGRPKRTFKDGFEFFAGRVIDAIRKIGGPRPTCNRHHQSGTLVDL